MENEQQTQRAGGRSYFLPVSILIAAVLISGSIIYSNGRRAISNGRGDEAPQVVKVSAGDDPVLGSKDAKITLIEFSDFQCPFCRKLWREVTGNVEFQREYIDSGKVKLVYRDWPISGHPAALISALSAECADDQGKFWEMHDKIFIEQDKKSTEIKTIVYTIDDLKRWAKDIGLDMEKFNQCVDAKKYETEVQEDFNDGLAVGVDGTPVTFINGKPLVGAQPLAVFKAILDAELAKK